MHMRIKLFVGLVCVALGLGVAIYQAFQTNWLNALSALLLGPSVGIAFLLGFETSRESFYIQALVGLTAILGIMAILFEHRAFDFKRTEAHAAVLGAFVRMQLACPVMNTELSKIQKEGIMACALQDNSDQVSAIAELQKTTTLGPTLSLVDSVRSAAQKPNADWCAEAFRVAQPLCTEAFVGVRESSKQLLLQKK